MPGKSQEELEHAVDPPTVYSLAIDDRGGGDRLLLRTTGDFRRIPIHLHSLESRSFGYFLVIASRPTTASFVELRNRVFRSELLLCCAFHLGLEHVGDGRHVPFFILWHTPNPRIRSGLSSGGDRP
jgi:hypothetical protein